MYLDALFSYAYVTPQEMELRATLLKLKDDLEAVALQPLAPLGDFRSPEVVTAIMTKMSDVQGQLASRQPPVATSTLPPTVPTPADLASYGAYDSWSARVRGYRAPEAEYRQVRPVTAEGRLGSSATPPRVPDAIRAGLGSFSDIRVPALALCAMPAVTAGGDATHERAFREARQAAFEANVPGARVVRIPGANHYIFITHESDVLREVSAFVSHLQ